MSDGNTGRPGGGQAPAGTTPPGQNGSPNGRGTNGSGKANGWENREELAGTRAGAARTGPGNGTAAPRTQPSANPVRPQPNGAQAKTAAPSAARPQPSANPRTAQQPGQRPAPVTSWAPKGARRPGGAQPSAANQSGAANRPPASGATPPPGPNVRAGGAQGQAPTTATAAHGNASGTKAPTGDTRPRPDSGVPVWDPPPPRGPKQSWRDRLGLAKKEADPNAFQRPTTAPGAAAAGAAGAGAATGAGTTAAMSAPPVTNPARTAAPPTSAPRPTGATAPTAPTSRTGGPISTPQPTPQPNPATTTNRAAVPAADSQTFGLKPSGRAPTPAQAPPTAQAPTGGPSTTGGGGSARPLYRAAPPVTAPTQPVAPGAPGAGAPGVRPAAGSTAVGAAAGAAGAAAAAPSAAETTGSDVLASGKSKAGIARRTRKARLRLSRLDPWSVMKTSFLFSIAAGIMLVVATYAVWTVLSTSGLFPAVNDIVASVVSTPGDTTPFRIEEYINTRKVLGVAALIACVDVVIFTALATLGSFLYNLAATVLGGLEITLAED